MKINCELPVELMPFGKLFNHYEFVLFHLLKNKDYSDCIHTYREAYPGRLMIMDNSAYEMFVKGEEIVWNEYVGAINEYKPDYYILPDKLMDYEATIEGAKKFIEKYGDKISKRSKPLAVAQGNSDEELVKAINEYRNMGVNYIGIPFHLKYYPEGEYSPEVVDYFRSKGYEETEDVRYAMGRVRFVLKHKDLLKEIEHIHFLGSHCPFEKHFYQEFSTMDTGYPVKLAMTGIRLGEEKRKPEILVDDYINKHPTAAQADLILENMNIFRNI